MSPILHYLSLKLNFKFNSRSLFYLVALLTTCPQHIQTCLPEILTGLITALRELSLLLPVRPIYFAFQFLMFILCSKSQCDGRYV